MIYGMNRPRSHKIEMILCADIRAAVIFSGSVFWYCLLWKLILTIFSNFPASTKTKRPVVFLKHHQITFNFCPNKCNSASLSSKREIPYWKTIKAPRFDDNALRADDQLWMKDNIRQVALDHIASEKKTTMECLLVKLSLGCLQQISYQRHGMFQKELLQHFSLNKDSWPHGSCCGGCRAPQTPRPGRGLPAPSPFSSSSSLSLTSSSLTKSMSLADCFSGHPYVLGISLEPKRGRLGQPTRMTSGQKVMEYQPPSRVS